MNCCRCRFDDSGHDASRRSLGAQASRLHLPPPGAQASRLHPLRRSRYRPHVFVWLRGSLGFLLLLILGVACDSRPGQASAARLANESIEAAVPVRLGKLERGAVSNRLAVDATLEAVAKADYHGKIAGVVDKVLKREGDEVIRGAIGETRLSFFSC